MTARPEGKRLSEAELAEIAKRLKEAEKLKEGKK